MMKKSQFAVVVTGAGAGVGRATAREFARRGARLGLIERDADRLASAVDDVRRLGGTGFGVPCDVANAAALDAAADAIEREVGPIAVWVNNAMATIFSPVADIGPDDFRRATEVTYLGTVYGTMAALRRMRPRNRGTIVQVGSALAYRAIPLQSAYCGSKFAIRGFTDALRCELLHERSRIHVTMVHLPAINTPQFDWARSTLEHRPQPVPPIFEPETAARAIVWASRHRRREVLLGLPTVGAVWANRFVPGLLDRYLARTAYASQQSKEPQTSDHPDNLWAPVSGTFAAHGRFDSLAENRNLQAWLTVHGRTVAAALGLGALGALGLLKATRRAKH